jgi:hypothetical protein
MPRNFGVRRNLFGEELFRSYWGEPANDNRRELVWPYIAIGAAVVAIVAVGVFA